MILQINPLTDTSRPYIVCAWIDQKGAPRTFRSEVNSMTGSRLSSLDNGAPTVDDSMKWVRSVVLEAINTSLKGSFHSIGKGAGLKF